METNRLRIDLRQTLLEIIGVIQRKLGVFEHELQ